MSVQGSRGPGRGSPAEAHPPSGPSRASEIDELHAELAAAGARISRPHGRPVVERFGDVVGEHGHLTGGAALLDETDRAILEVFGRRASQMLAGLLTNDLAPLERGRAVYTFLLTPKGRPVAEARALPRPEGAFWLDVPAACLEGLLGHLGRTLPPLYARFEPRPGIARLSVVGPRAGQALAAWPEGPGGDVSDLPPLALARPEAEDAGWVLAACREPVEGPGYDLYVPASCIRRAWSALAAAVETVAGGVAGREAYDIWRIERGVPAYGPDIGLDNLPQETGQQERAISLSKGCYTGQEVVARIHYRGHVNRHLRGLRVREEAEPPFSATDELYREGRAVGRVTSAARSPRLGAIGLGYVRREVTPGERVARSPGGRPAVEVVELPFTTT